MEDTNRKKLGVAELTCYGIGNSIGSGIFVSMGMGIAFTGKSIPLALVVACVVVLFAYAYHTLMAGMFVLPGGKYAQAALLQPPLLTGVSAISTIFTGLAFAMFAVSIVQYASEVFPQITPYGKWIALAIVTLFFITTFFGGKFMGKFNLIMVAVLIVSLLLFVIFGLPKVDFSVLNPSADDYFRDGPMGFIMAVAALSFACQGSTMPIAMTADSKDPKKTMPKAILISSAVVMFIYALIGIVAVGVLPIEEVIKDQDKSLGVVAHSIFPRPLFVIFILCGACLAIATSLYGAIASIQHPLLATVEDGWLPKFLGIKTKKGYPWVMMLILYIIAAVPIFVETKLNELISLMMIPIMILNLLNNILMIKLVKKYPSAWKKGFFRMPKAVFYITIIFAVLCDLLICVALFTQLKAGDQYFIIAMIVLLFAYSAIRIKMGKVNLKEIELAKEEAEKDAVNSI